MRRQWEWSLAWMDCLLVGYRRRKPQATSQKRRRASQAECLSSLPSPSIMNEKNNWLRDGMKRWDWRAMGMELMKWNEKLNFFSFELNGINGMSFGPLQVKLNCSFVFFHSLLAVGVRRRNEKKRQREGGTPNAAANNSHKWSAQQSINFIHFMNSIN